MAVKNCSNASSPPADAPIPTIKLGTGFDRSKRNTALDLALGGEGVIFPEFRLDAVAVFRLSRIDSLPITAPYIALTER